MEQPKNLLYTETHEWVRPEGDEVVVGITDFAQAQLSDLTFVELPSVGDAVSAQDELAVVESVKAASDIYTPVSGEVTGVNDQLSDHPDLINSDPYGEGWLFRVKLSDPSELDGLLSAEAYQERLPDAD